MRRGRFHPVLGNHATAAGSLAARAGLAPVGYGYSGPNIRCNEAGEFGTVAHRPDAIDAWVHALQKYDFIALFPIEPSLLARYRKAFRPSRAKVAAHALAFSSGSASCIAAGRPARLATSRVASGHCGGAARPCSPDWLRRVVDGTAQGMKQTLSPRLRF